MDLEHRLAARALCLWMGIAAGSPGQAGITAIKCWTNGEGVRECGNAVPTEYAQQGHTVYNDHGVQVGTRQRAKSGEELAEEQRLAALQAEEKRKTEEVAKADRVLLETFSSEDDLISRGMESYRRSTGRSASSKAISTSPRRTWSGAWSWSRRSSNAARNPRSRSLPTSSPPAGRSRRIEPASSPSVGSRAPSASASTRTSSVSAS
jgi:hypothetical protein